MRLCALGQKSAVDAEFREGAEAMRAGRAADAEQHFRSAVRLAPRLADAHLDLSLVLAREGKLAEAIASVQKAVELNPHIPSGELFLGIFLHQVGREPEAREALKLAVEQDRTNIEPLKWLATVDLAAGQPEAAAASLDRAAEIAPDDEEVLESRGHAHSLAAQESYSRMAKLNPGSWHVHRVQAELMASEGKHVEAAAELEKAVAKAPANPDLWEALGEQYRAANNLDEAKRAFAKEYELSPGNALAMYNLGSVDVERGEVAAGVPLLRTMLSTYQSSPVAAYYLGRGLAAGGEPAEAARWLQEAARDGNGGEISKRAYYELARLYRKTGDLPASQTALASYNRIREAAEKVSAQQVQDWRKLGSAEPATGAAP